MTKTTALEKTLQLFISKNTVTPAEINHHVRKGNYASKYVLYLKLAGHDIKTNKNGRTVLNYTYEGVNLNVDTTVKPSERRVSKMFVTPAPVAPAPVAPVKTKKAKAKSVQKEVFVPKVVDDAEQAFGSTGAVTSFTVDPDWDNDVDDVRALLR